MTNGHPLYLIELYPWGRNIESDVAWLPAPMGTVAFGQISGKKYGGLTRVFLSDHHFVTEPDDTPANRYFHPVVDSALQYDMSLLNGQDIGINNPTFGAIEIANGDGALDGFSQLSWRGRRVVVKSGYEGARYTDYVTVFDGLCSAIEYSDTSIILTISDKGLLLDREIISPEYAGTGGLEGNADIAGRMKPLAYGRCFNIEPMLVDPVNLVYQVHSGSMEGVDAVFDAGIALTFDADYADISTANPTSGKYATSLATGHIKLGSTPAGRITANVRGDNTGGYASDISQVCVRMATTLYGNESFQPADIDTAAWADLSTSVPGDIGVYISERRTLRQVFDELLNQCLAYWYFTRGGLLAADVVDIEGMPDFDIPVGEIDTSGVEMTETIPPAWKISVAYAPVWTMQKEDELAGGATEQHRMFVGNQYRLSTYENRAIRAEHPTPFERVFYTNFADKSAAEALMDRLIRIYGRERKIYRGVGYSGLFNFGLGDAVSLSYPRYGINGVMTVMGISEDTETGQTTMELWG